MIIPSFIGRLTWYSLSFYGNSALIGYVYPSYATFKAIRARSTKTLQKLLILWTVMGFIQGMSLLGDAFLYWLPLYDEIKVLIYIWLIFPDSHGAFFLYNSYLQPMLIQNEKTIDKNIKYWGLKMESALGEIGRRFIIQIQTYIDHLTHGVSSSAPSSSIPSADNAANGVEFIDLDVDFNEESKNDKTLGASNSSSIESRRNKEGNLGSGNSNFDKSASFQNSQSSQSSSSFPSLLKKTTMTDNNNGK